MKKINVFSFVLMSALCFFVGSSVFAQNADSSETNVTEENMVLVADVNLDRGEILSQDDKKIYINFVLSNGEGPQPDIKYAVILSVKNQDGSEVIVDKKIYNEIINLNSGDSIEKEIEYTLPDYLRNGTYNVTIYSENSSGLPLAFIGLGEINIANNQEFSANLQNCRLVVEGQEYSLNEGIDVLSNESMNLVCDIDNNFSENISLVPSFKTNLRSSFGEKVGDESGSIISLNSSINNNVQIPIPVRVLPQSYTVDFSLFNNEGKQVSNDVSFHYVVVGESATIQNITLDKINYKKNETAEISLFISKPADNFLSSRFSGTELSEVNLDLAIFDKNGSECSNQLQNKKISLDEVFTKIKINILKDCFNPTVSATIKNNQGNELFNKKVAFDRESEDSSLLNDDTITVKKNSDYVFIVSIVVLILVIGLSIFFVVKAKKKKMNFVFFLIFGLVYLFSFSSPAEAAIFCGDWNSVCVTDNITISDCKATMSAYVSDYQCGNYTYEGSVSVSGNLNGTSNYSSTNVYVSSFTSSKLAGGTYPVWGYVSVAQNCKSTRGDDDCTKNKNRSFAFITSFTIPASCSTTTTTTPKTPTTPTTPKTPVSGTCDSSATGEYSWDAESPNTPLCSTGNVTSLSPSDGKFYGYGSDSNVTWKCDNSGQISGTCTAWRDTSCGTAAKEFNNQYSTPSEWNSATATSGYFCASGTTLTPADPLPVFPNAGETVTWSCNNADGGGETCSATNNTAGVVCPTGDWSNLSKDQISSKSDAELCGPNGKLKESSSVHADDTYWKWECIPSNLPVDLNPDDYFKECQVENCLAKTTFNEDLYVYFKDDGTVDPAKVFVESACSDLCCTYTNDGKSINTCDSDNLKSGEIILNGHPDEIIRTCIGGPGDDDDDDDDDTKFYKEFEIKCVCTANKCTSNGSCAATPVFARSIKDANCSSECSSDSDCGGGGNITETN